MTLLRLTPAIGTHRGMRRRYNEDALNYEYPADPDILAHLGALFIVADGVGSLPAGDEASQMAVDRTIHHYYATDLNKPLEKRLAQTVQQVNTEVFNRFSGNGATTLVAVVIIGDQMLFTSVGDSLIFRMVGEKTIQLNEEDVLKSDNREGALTRAIGYREQLDVRVTSLMITSGDRILLCSDGLTRYLRPSQLNKLAQFHDPRDSVRRMINDANAAGGADNISAIVIKVGEPIAPQDIAEHLAGIAVRVAVNTDPLLIQDVPSKPTTQIPLKRPEAIIDEPLVQAAATAASVQDKTVSPPKKRPDQSNRTLIISAVVVIVVGLVIVVFALLLLTGNQNESQGIGPEQTGDLILTVPSTRGHDALVGDGIEVGDTIILSDVVLTWQDIGSEISAFLASADTPYLIERIAEGSEGNSWYLLLEEGSAQTGWLSQPNLPDYTLWHE